MLIATYNLRFGGSKKNREHWAEILDFVQADIFLVQETCDPKLYLDNTFYESYKEQIVWQNVEGRPWGSALFFRHGTVQPILVPGFEGWVAGASVTGFGYPLDDEDPLHVFSIHAPHPQKSSYDKEVTKILDFILEHYSEQGDLIVGGDFNMTTSIRSSEQPYTWDPEDWRTRMKRELHLINCWQAANPNCELAQTLRWSGNPDHPYHCDGIFVPAYWYPYLQSSQVLNDGWEDMSDHYPVVATFEEDELDEAMKSTLSAEDYRSALIGIQDKLTSGQRAMLIAHYHASEHRITAAQLAEAAGYKNYQGANLQYAMVGQKIAHHLNHIPMQHSSSRQPFWSSVLADGYWQATPSPEQPSGKTWYWVMWSELAQALETLKWE